MSAHPHVDDPPLVVGVDQLVLPSPFPVRGVLLRTFSIHPAHQAGDGDPEEQRHNDHRPDHVVLQELEHCADADVVDEVPDPDDVLVGLLTLALVAESLKARRSVRENINRRHSVARAVQIPPATTLASVRTVVAHAALLALSFAEWDTLALLALALLDAAGPVLHVVGLRALSGDSRALGVLLARGEVGRAALGVHLHVLAVVAARRVLVAADRVLSKAAVLVAAGVAILGAKKSCVTLLVAFHPQVATEGLLGFCEAPRRLCKEHFADEAETARGELFVVDVVTGDAVGVHEVRSPLAGRRAALGDVGVMFASPVMAELVSCHQVGLSGDHALAIVVPA